MSRCSIRAMIVVTLALTTGMAVAEDTFRCGSRLVEPGMTQAEVRQMCGDPTSISTELQDVRSGNQVVGQSEVQRWTYESYSAKRVLVFDQETLKSIE